MDDLDGPDAPFKVLRPNLETASKRMEKAQVRRFWLRQGVGQAGPNQAVKWSSILVRSADLMA
jgi:hypothetical protein